MKETLRSGASQRTGYRLLSSALILITLVLFTIANRGAYKSFFQADSIDNIALMRALGFNEIYRPLLLPKVGFNNFRPVGMLFYKLMGAQFGLWFPPYVAALQILHILNVALLVWLMRKLKLPFLAACAGALFFVFHMALFSVFWEPMFVFDLICGCLCILSLAAYIEGRWIVSFLLFWLAYRTKENAIMLPAALAAYEILMGPRRWKRLIPFFALSLVLGVQALMNNAVRVSDYTLKFDPASIWRCLSFYSSQVLLIPFAGFAILALPLRVRSRPAWFGLVLFCILLFPMLLLPGRLFGAYLYAPLLGAAILVAAVAQKYPRTVIAALLVLWIPWNFVNMRWLRNAELTRAATERHYVANVIQAAQAHPDVNTFLYHGVPREWYVIPAVLNLVRQGPAHVKVLEIGDKEARKLLQTEPVVVLDWEPTPIPGSVVTLAHTPQTPDTSYIRLDRSTPVWQLESGWNLGEKGRYRWMQPSSSARLTRPPNAKQFELEVNITPLFLEYVHRSHLRLLLDGRLIGERDFDHPVTEVLRWDAGDGPPGPVHIAFETQPGFQIDPSYDVMGLSVGNFGFVAQ